MKVLQKINVLFSIIVTLIMPLLIIVFCFGEKKMGWLNEKEKQE